MTAPTLAELVRELRQCCPKRNIRTIMDGHVLPCDDPIHAFEERLTATWHEKGCTCNNSGKCGECGSYHLVPQATENVDPRCAEARRTAREEV